MNQTKLYLCNIPNFHHTYVFEDIYLYMIESGLWFFLEVMNLLKQLQEISIHIMKQSMNILNILRSV